MYDRYIRVKQIPFMQGVLRAQSDMKWIAVKDIKIVCINGGKVSFSDCHDEYCGHQMSVLEMDEGSRRRTSHDRSYQTNHSISEGRFA